MFEYLNCNSSAIQAISSVCILFVTLAYSIATYFMYREMKNQRTLYETPDIQIRLIPIGKSNNKFDLVAENISKVAAYDLELELYPKDFEFYTNRKLIDVGFFNKPTKYFGVNEKVNICFILVNFVIKKNKSIKITASYKDIKNNIYRKEFNLDFSQYYESPEISRNDIHDLTKIMEEFVKYFKEFNKSFEEYKNKS